MENVEPAGCENDKEFNLNKWKKVRRRLGIKNIVRVGRYQLETDVQDT